MQVACGIVSQQSTNEGSTDGDLCVKKLEAIVRPNMIELAKEALTDVGCAGMTISEVKGFGRQMGHSEVYRGAEYVVSFQPKIKIEVVMPDELVDDAVRALVAAAATGQVGDGKIFISSVEDALRLRTGDTGDDAVS